MHIPELWVILCSDTEDNQPNYLPYWQTIGSDYDKNPAIIKWDWVKFWPKLIDYFRKYNIPITWLIRVDNGPVYDQMLVRFESIIKDLIKNGDEVGIHIHTLIWNKILSKWVQTSDPKSEEIIVTQSLEYFKNSLGFYPGSVRMGCNTMSDRIMSVLEKFNISVDASAIPGNYCSGKFGCRDNLYDWRSAPTHPYHPSVSSYLEKGNSKILEVPITTLPSGNITNSILNRLSNNKIGSLIKSILPITKKLPSFNPNNYFYISPYWSGESLKKFFRHLSYKNNENPSFLVGFFHSADIIDPRTCKENIDFMKSIHSVIMSIKSIKDVDIKFLTLNDVASRLII